MEQAKLLHEEILRMTGGERGHLNRSNPDYLLEAVRDIGAECEWKKAILKKAAFLLYNIVVLHPFVNGNKRNALEVVNLFLTLNGLELVPKTEAAYAFLIQVASGDASLADVESWIGTNITERQVK